MPIAQRRTVDEVVVALASLELFGEGSGVLRYRMGRARGWLRPHRVPVRHKGGAIRSRADLVPTGLELPEKGEIGVEVVHLVSLRFDEETGEEIEEDSYEGPWTFRFSI